MLASKLAEKMFAGKMDQGQTLTLEEYQEKCVVKMVRRKKHILGLPMGTGKTPVAFETLHRSRPESVLLLPTSRALVGWLKTMWCWYPQYLDRFFIVDKRYSKEVRAQFWKEHRKKRGMHIIMNWQTAVRDASMMPKEWDMVVADEYHKFLRSRDNKTHNMMKAWQAEKQILISGSPASKGSADFWIPLNLFDKKLFSSYWRFVGTYAYVSDSPFGKQVYGSRNMEQFQKVLRDYAIIATKRQLGLQKKIRDIFPVEMTDIQQEAYDALRDDFILEIEEGPTLVMLNTLAVWMKLRQLLTCPAIIHPSLGAGGGLLDIMETLRELPKEERHSVIFTPFRVGTPWIKAILEGRGQDLGVVDAPKEGLGVPVFVFQGGMSTQELFAQLEVFKKTGGIAVCVIKFAESFDMETVDKCFFLGAEWDPQENYQAEDRLDRLTNLHGIINCHYVMHQNTVDEDIMMALAVKQTNVMQIYSTRSELMALLKGH